MGILFDLNSITFIELPESLNLIFESFFSTIYGVERSNQPSTIPDDRQSRKRVSRPSPGGLPGSGVFCQSETGLILTSIY